MLDLLPNEVIFKILLFLPFAQLAQIKLINRRFDLLTKDNYLWRKIIMIDAPIKNPVLQYLNILDNKKYTFDQVIDIMIENLDIISAIMEEFGVKNILLVETDFYTECRHPYRYGFLHLAVRVKNISSSQIHNFKLVLEMVLRCRIIMWELTSVMNYARYYPYSSIFCMPKFKVFFKDQLYDTILGLKYRNHYTDLLLCPPINLNPLDYSHMPFTYNYLSFIMMPISS